MHRIHAVSVCDADDTAQFYVDIDTILGKLGLSKDSDEGRSAVRTRDVVDIIEGHQGRGYALSTDEELGVVTHVCHPSTLCITL